MQNFIMQRPEKLTGYVRMKIYSFIPLRVYVTKVAILSRRERKFLIDSEIASEGKKYVYYSKIYNCSQVERRRARHPEERADPAGQDEC